MTIEPGSRAPDFTVKNASGSEASLHALLEQGRVLLVFYPFAFSGLCTGELQALQRELEGFTEVGVTPVVMSCDPFFALQAFGQEHDFTFTMLSDFWPHGEVARAFGVFSEEMGCAVRASFLIGTDGVVEWSVVNDIKDTRSIDEHLQAAREKSSAAV